MLSLISVLLFWRATVKSTRRGILIFWLSQELSDAMKCLPFYIQWSFSQDILINVLTWFFISISRYLNVNNEAIQLMTIYHFHIPYCWFWTVFLVAERTGYCFYKHSAILQEILCYIIIFVFKYNRKRVWTDFFFTPIFNATKNFYQQSYLRWRVFQKSRKLLLQSPPS